MPPRFAVDFDSVYALSRSVFTGMAALVLHAVIILFLVRPVFLYLMTPGMAQQASGKNKLKGQCKGLLKLVSWLILHRYSERASLQHRRIRSPRQQSTLLKFSIGGLVIWLHRGM